MNDIRISLVQVPQLYKDNPDITRKFMELFNGVISVDVKDTEIITDKKKNTVLKSKIFNIKFKDTKLASEVKTKWGFDMQHPKCYENGKAIYNPNDNYGTFSVTGFGSFQAYWNGNCSSKQSRYGWILQPTPIIQKEST